MAKNKTTFTDQKVSDFIDQLLTEEQKSDSLELIQIMEKTSGAQARMWGPSIIGFGEYAYQYASGHKGNAPVIGFSPKKAAISLYVFTGLPDHQPYLDGLGKHKMGKACIYVKRLTDIHLDVLENLMKATIEYLEKTYSRIR